MQSSDELMGCHTAASRRHLLRLDSALRGARLCVQRDDNSTLSLIRRLYLGLCKSSIFTARVLCRASCRVLEYHSIDNGSSLIHSYLCKYTQLGMENKKNERVIMSKLQ